MSSSTINTSIDLGLPSTPKVTAPIELYNELLTIYNAIRALATGVDDYTNSGELVENIIDNEIAIRAAVAVFKRGLKAIKQDMDELPNVQANFAELRKQYYRYTVPKFTISTDLSVKNKFSLGDPATKPPIGVQTVTKTSNGVAASGAGTAAGGFDTAASRDAAIAAINANAAAITEVQTFLKNFGLFQ